MNCYNNQASRVPFVRIVMILLIANITTLSIAQFAGGEGTAENPYQVANAHQLDNVRDYLDAYFMQTDNIDLDIEPYNMEQGWIPIGDDNNPFEGSYDGDDHSVEGLYINRPDIANQGLFGYVNDEASIKNLDLIVVEITGRNNVGALAGYITGGSEIIGCSSSGTVIGRGNNIGGLIGYQLGSTLLKSYSNVVVEGILNVGGLVGNCQNVSRIGQCYTAGTVNAGYYIGGLVGRLVNNSSITDSYSSANVDGNYVGGLVGYQVDSHVANCYSVGTVQGHSFVKGLIGYNFDSETTNSYWNTETSNRNDSDGGEPRTTGQMTYPYDEETYIEWDFEDVWAADVDGEINNGYPFLIHNRPPEPSPNPTVATLPQPEDEETDVEIDLDNIQWSYISDPFYTDPVGFRVYMNTTGDFNEDDQFVWIPYEEEQTRYSTSEIFPDEFDYYTRYYWKVIPTTIDPGRRGGSELITRRENERIEDLHSHRGDAVNCPVWSFKTESIPYPKAAENPIPADKETDVSVSKEMLGWDYISDPEFTDPAGFKIFIAEEPDFDPDDFLWVPYEEEQQSYSVEHNIDLKYVNTYYWQVIPTTVEPARRLSQSKGPSSSSRVPLTEYHAVPMSESKQHRQSNTQSRTHRSTYNSYRGDAEDCPVWKFTTQAYPYPRTAENPIPADDSTGIPVGLEYLSWDYNIDTLYTNPEGFRVYFNTTGEFDEDDTFVWVSFNEEQVTYTNSAILPEELKENTKYYWLVVPTTKTPDGRFSMRKSNTTSSAKHSRKTTLSGKDAPDCQIWKFTTGYVGIEDEETTPYTTELYPNYPNPFNPETTISFSLAESSEVILEIFNNRGQKVIRLLDNNFDSGKHNVTWNGRDSYNNELSSGVYFYRLLVSDISGNTFFKANKMILLR